MVGGEVTAFTSEVEKARWEAIERAKATSHYARCERHRRLDVETSDMGTQNGILLFSATGTAVIIEPENFSGLAKVGLMSAAAGVSH